MDEINVAERDGVLHVTLNRPDDGNAATDPMAGELRDILRGAADRASIVVLRGAGADFCRGRASGKMDTEDPVEFRRRSDLVFSCYQSFRDCAVPIVAAVTGRAYGFGCALAALADITLADAGATFQVPEMNHRILPTMVMSALVDRVPRKAVNYLVYTRAVVSAGRAQEMHIVSEIAPAGGIDAALDALLRNLAVVPRPALLGVKDYTRTAYDLPLSGAVDYARNLHAVVNISPQMRTT